MTSRPPDPQRHLLGGDPPAVVMSARVAALLDRMRLDHLRREVRGTDVELDETLTAVHIAALRFAEAQPISDVGNAEVPTVADVARSSYERIGTSEVSAIVGVSPRQVVNLTGVLFAEKVAGVWMFDPVIVRDYAAQRAAKEAA